MTPTIDDHHPAPIGERVTSSEISSLIVWMRRLTEAGPRQADPAELAAFHRAKQDLLARIQHYTPTPNTPADHAVDQAGAPRD
jgi:hypothetical protein